VPASHPTDVPPGRPKRSRSFRNIPLTLRLDHYPDRKELVLDNTNDKSAKDVRSSASKAQPVEKSPSGEELKKRRQDLEAAIDVLKEKVDARENAPHTF
jgi:hypothetical protein